MESRRIKILAIVDHQDNQKTLLGLIKKAHPEALTFMVLDSRKGFKLAATENPDVIFLDNINLGKNSYDFCRKLKENNGLSDIPVVFITDQESEKDCRICALEAGAEAFLTKPFDESELTALISVMVKIKNVNIKNHNEKERLNELVDKNTEELKVTYQGALDLLEDYKRENENRIKKEEALQESEEHYRELANSITDIFFGMDAELRYTYWNNACEKFSGFSAQEVIGKHFNEVFHGIPPIWGLEEKYKSVLETQQYNSFITSYPFNDKNIFLEISVYPSKKGISVFVKDITERKEIEETLRESEENFKDIFQTVKEGIVYSMITGEIISINSALEQILEISKEEIIGKNIIALSKKTSFFNEFNSINPVLEELLHGEKNHPIKVKYKNKILEVYTIINLKSERITGVIRDITERELAEIKLVESEKRYMRITSGLTDYLYTVIIINGKVVETIHNEACFAITGYSPEEFASDPYLWINMVVSEEREYVKNNFLKILEGKDVPSIEHRIVRKDGTIRWISDTAILKYDSKGELISYDGVIKDITERKLAEKELFESEKKFKTLFETANDAIMLMNDTTFIDCNTKTESMFGCLKKDIIGRSPIELSPQYQHDGRLSIDIANEKISAALGGHPQFFEWKHCHFDGSPFDTEVSLNSIELNGVTCLQAIARDVSERKQAGERLKESEEQLKLVLEGSKLGFWDWDLNTNVVQRNERWAEMLGYTLDEIKFTVKQWTDLIHPEDREKALLSLKKHLEGYTPHHQIEYRMLTKDKQWKWIYDSAKIVKRDEHDEPIRMSGTHTDISERKLVEEKLLESEKHYRDLFENAIIAIFQSSVEGKIMAVNPEFVHMFGYTSAKDLVNTVENAANLFADPNRRNEIIRLKTEQPELTTFENLYRRKDGSIFLGKLSIRQLFDSKTAQSYFEGFIEDITERKRLEKLILTQAEVTKNMTEGVCIIGLQDPTIHWVNCRFEEMFGYEKGEMIGKHISIVNAPTDIAPIEKFNEIMAIINRTREWHGEIYNIKKDGTKFWCYASVSTFMHPDYGDVLLSIHTDITERKQAEEQIIQSKKQLEQFNLHLVQAIEDERARISREIHDELGQSLTALKMDLGWVNDNVEDSSEIKNKIVDMIDIASYTIKKVQRISSDLRPGMLDELGLIPAMDWYIQEFENRSGIKCLFKPESTKSIDENKNLTLYRILQESLTNVYRHANAKNVIINLYQIEDSIILDTIDDGIGMEKEKIFSNTSLGLIGIRERAKLFNGNVEIFSDQQNGTRLKVSIPI